MALRLNRLQAEKSRGGGEDGVQDRRVGWFEQRIAASLRLKHAEMRKLMDNDDNRANLMEFLDQPDRRNVFVAAVSITKARNAAGDAERFTDVASPAVASTNSIPYSIVSGEYDQDTCFRYNFLNRKIIYFAKTKKEKLTDERLFATKVLVGETSPHVLQSLFDVSQQFFVPLIEFPTNNATEVADVLRREVAEKNSEVLSQAVVALGKSYRRTALPLPAALKRAVMGLAVRQRIVTDTGATQEPAPIEGHHRNDRETVHDLESATSEWLALIKEAVNEAPPWWSSHAGGLHQGEGEPIHAAKPLIPRPPSSSAAAPPPSGATPSGAPKRFNARRGTHGPVDEIVFFEEKRANLTQLEVQIYGGAEGEASGGTAASGPSFFVVVVRCLKNANSSYYGLLVNALDELHSTLLDTAETCKYLRPFVTNSSVLGPFVAFPSATAAPPSLQPLLAHHHAAGDGISGAPASFTPHQLAASMADLLERIDEGLFEHVFRYLTTLWSHCTSSFASPPRMVTFIQGLANEIVRFCRECVDADGLDLLQSEPEEIVKALTQVLSVCGKFKSAYFDAKGRLARSGSGAPWKFQNQLLFSNLDACLERVHDLLDIVESTVVFNKALNVRVGGAESVALCEQIDGAVEGFKDAMREFQSMFPEGSGAAAHLLETDDGGQFEHLYHGFFRPRVALLEARLAQIAGSAWGSAGSSLVELGRVSDSFESLAERPVGRLEWESRQPAFLDAWHGDLLDVQATLLENTNVGGLVAAAAASRNNGRGQPASDHHPPHVIDPAHLSEAAANLEKYCGALYPNTPSSTAAVMYCQGLIRRIETAASAAHPRLTTETLALPRAQDCITMQRRLTKEVQHLMNAVYESWASVAGQVSEQRLQLPVLRFDDAANVFVVNFDPYLARTLKEALFFEQQEDAREEGGGDASASDFTIPASVKNLARSRDRLRIQTMRLSHICEVINTVRNELTEAARGLLEEESAALYNLLMSVGVSTLLWADEVRVGDFIDTATTSVQLLERSIECLRGTLNTSLGLIDGMRSSDKLFPTTSTKHDTRVLTAPDLKRKLAEHLNARKSATAAIGTQINSALQVLFAKLNDLRAGGGRAAGLAPLNESEPRWRAYVREFAKDIRGGLLDMTIASLRGLEQQLDTNGFGKTHPSGVPPLVDLKLTLSRPPMNLGDYRTSPPSTAAIVFDPPLESIENQAAAAAAESAATAVDPTAKRKSAASSVTFGGSVNQLSSSTAAAGPTPMEAARERILERYAPARAPTDSLDALVKDFYIGGVISVASACICSDAAAEKAKKSTEGGAPFLFGAVDEEEGFGAAAIQAELETNEEVMSLLRRVSDHMRDTYSVAGATCLPPFEEFAYLFNDNVQQAFEDFLEREREYGSDDEDDAAAEQGEGTTNDNNEDEGGRDEDDGEGGVGRRKKADSLPYFSAVQLSSYETEIRKLEELYDVLGDLPTSFTAGFVRVDAKPIRQTLIDQCGRWRDVFVSHLTLKMTSDLRGLYDFITYAEAELAKEVQDGDIETLKRAMKCIRECRSMNLQVDRMLSPISEALVMLKRHTQSVKRSTLEEIEQLLKTAQERWSAINRKALNTREQHSGAMDREAQFVKQQTAAFEDRLREVTDELHGTQLYLYSTNSDDAYSSIDRWAATTVATLQAEAAQLRNLQGLFELTKAPFLALTEIRTELALLKHVWDLVCHIRGLFDDWMQSPFAYVDVEAFLDTIRLLQKQLKQQPLRTKDWDVYKGLVEATTRMAKTLPLLAELRSPAMRDRHWQSLYKLTGHHHNQPSSSLSQRPSLGSVSAMQPAPHGDSFTLQNLVDLGIHNHTEEVLNIVERAVKEHQLERQLSKIEETWGQLNLEFVDSAAKAPSGAVKAAEGSIGSRLPEDVPLFAAVDSIVEQLENDSNTLQGTLANRFIEYFIDRVTTWQINLGVVESTLVRWVDLQRRWSNLYPIFVLSADIREQLPEDSQRFEEADETFQSVQRATKVCRSRNTITLLCTDVVVETMEAASPTTAAVLRRKSSVMGSSSSLLRRASSVSTATHIAATIGAQVVSARRQQQQFSGPAGGAPHASAAVVTQLESCLQTIEDMLVQCEKSLADYLETKRKLFPRFFFVSSADLVDILSKGSNPRAVMTHMSKIIDSVETFHFDGNDAGSVVGRTILKQQQGLHVLENTPAATAALSGATGAVVPSTTHNAKGVWAMESVQGELVRLEEEFVCEGPVEAWMDGCVVAMQRAMRMHIGEAHSGYTDRPRHEWMYMYPCQAVIVASRSYFTAETTQAFTMLEEGNDQAIKEHAKQLRGQLDTLVKEVLTPKDSNVRKMLVHLITIDVHNRDIVQGLVDERVESSESFVWQSQLRYYWDPKRGSEIRIADAEFVNGYEYIGLCGCLVITKLTDRCYITLSQALRLKRGGAPAGPAGTGKTETTKDLARNLGIACYVFNCSDQMNYVTLGQVFKGLAMSGSWGCFDEFNRISVEVLSVVATQVGSILNALKAQRSEFRFMDAEDIRIVDRVGIFITMNPGYAGRTELPENIKALFRPCAMVVPDLKNICEIMLAAEGFSDAKDLALKFVTLYRLNKELLSPQNHYDWGLRAVKSVLYIAGSLKRADPDIPERRVLMRALRDTNLAKLSKDDVYVFMGLIQALFPNLQEPKKSKPALEKALLEQCKSMGNVPGDNNVFILKCVQYEELLHVRHSVFILGPTGSGKTDMWRCLQGALRRQGDQAVSSALNPKAISSSELYGFIHPQTREWKDGVLSNTFRQYAQESKVKKNTKWIVLDGIVDAEWIESMNTVMDDNKMLTLVSNERIPLTDSMRMIFEVSQLNNASPATVSRGGVVYINSSDLGWGAYRDKWLASREDTKESTILETLFDRFLPPLFDFYSRSLKTVIPIVEVAVVQTLCFLLEGLLEDLADKSTEVYEKYFAFATVWAFGGPLSSDGRLDYRNQFSTWWRREHPHLKMSDSGTVFDFFIDASGGPVAPEEAAMKSSARRRSSVANNSAASAAALAQQRPYSFRPWSELVQPYMHDFDAPLSSVTVQTADTVRMTHLMGLFMDRARPVMLVGTAGTGKTNLLSSKLATLDPATIMSRVIGFSAKTSALSLQAVLDQDLEKRSGRIYGPPNRKKIVFFLDDCNMSAPDKYGTQDSIALVQQHLNYGFWFDRNKMTPKEIHDVRYVAAMNPKSGSFSILDRVVRHFAVFSVNMPDKADLTRIYGQILSSQLAAFPHAVTQFLSPITAATIELHSQVNRVFKPTAILFFYQWNMRELFNVFQGLCSVHPKIHAGDGAQLVRLWAHECRRTFKDRMPNPSDRVQFEDILVTVQREFFPNIPVNQLTFPLGHQPTPEQLARAVSEGGFAWAPLRTTPDGDENVYDECPPSFCEAQISAALEGYNENFAVMELVLFEQALEHVCRIARVLSRPRGNLLLVGVGGSGKQSLTRLASYILGLEVAQVQVTSAYTIASFRTDLQELYKKCGLKGIAHTLLITDQQIVTTDMLVYLNDMLASGSIPELFVGDERDAVIGSIVNEVKQSGHPDYSSPDVCWDFFIKKVRLNLHIVLCLSPISPTFAPWCRQFPALSNNVVIDWFSAWPTDALKSVSRRFLVNAPELVALCPDEGIRRDIADYVGDCHLAATATTDEYFAAEQRRCFTTPKSFLATVQLYKSLLRQHSNKLAERTQRLVDGIAKIEEAAAQVAGLQEILAVESVEVADAKEKTAVLMETVGREKSIVEDQRAIAAVEEKKTNAIVSEVERFAGECRRDLAAAQPLVDSALAALNTLDKASLTELKSMARPPEDVIMVVAAVRVLTADPNRIPAPKMRDWGACKLMMGNVTNWMKDLLAFDAYNIPQPCVDAIQMYVTNAGFNPDNILTKSLAAAGLCKWVLAMHAFHKVRCEVRPKEQKMKEAEDRLTVSRSQLNRIQDKVADLQSKLDVLVAQFDEANAESQRIAAKAQKTMLKTRLAERLVGGLASEKIRWGQTIQDLQHRSKLLVGDVLLAAAFVSYAGAFTKPFRQRVMDNHWRPSLLSLGVPTTPNLDVVRDLLVTDSDVAQWRNDGLQSDPVSIQNGAIVVSCSRWPLLIDPQQQGVRWIKTSQARNGLVTTQQGAKGWLDKVVACVEDGLPCLIEGLRDSIDPVLENLLSRTTIKRGNKHLIRIGARDADLHPNFKLYLQTALANPVFSPEINAQTTLINCMVTEAGLADQLLAVVVQRDRRDLEEKRATLTRTMNTMTIDLQHCEDSLLVELASAGGDLLENVALVDSLEATKRKAVEIAASMAEAVTTQAKITQSRDLYQPCAERGALAYFVIDRLHKIDHMYQYSLEAFMVVFNKALEAAPRPADKGDVKGRVGSLSDTITKFVYAYVAGGMFERHKLILSSMLTFGILLRSGEIDRRQLDYLLQGKKKTAGEARPETVREWCAESNWAAVLALAEVEGTTPSFALLPSDMSDSNRWKVWADTEAPEVEKLPTDWKNLTQFQRLLILRSLRPDRLTKALELFVAAKIGRFYIEDQTASLGESYAGSSPMSPLFFVLSPGVDPVRGVEALGRTLGYTYEKGNFYNISLGQGQEAVADRALETCFADGGWCMLSNVHLVAKWLITFEKRMDRYAEVYRQMAVAAEEKALRRLAARHTALKSVDNGNTDEHSEDGHRSQGDDDGGEGGATDVVVDEDDEMEDSGDEDDQAGEAVQNKGSMAFRVFLSAEPSTNIPVSVLQRSIKLTSEPPTGIKQNLVRAMKCFSDEPWERSSKPTEFRAVTFALCFFHSVVVERKKFGPMGWNRSYPFNIGDLTTCVDVLSTTLEERPRVPWEDLRYVFGEIMYGGHITDDRDRLLCSAYLEKWITPELLDGQELAAGFSVPPPMTYAEYLEYIDDTCPPEGPLLYGLHPNSEVNFRTTQATTILAHIAELQPKDQSATSAAAVTHQPDTSATTASAVDTPADVLRAIVDDLWEKLPEQYNLVDVAERLEGDRSPTQHVFYQECERHNALLAVVRSSLHSIILGLKGELSISDEMQATSNELLLGRVPQQWMEVSFASERPLATWFDSLLQRYAQCNDWTAELTTPKVVMISYLFSPLALLTALMQTASIQNSYDLDQMGLLVEVTKKTADSVDVPARDGAFIYGAVIEGARWDGGQQSIDTSRPKELYPRMPVMLVRALPLGKLDRRDQYECPVYKTQARSHTYVTSLFLKTKSSPQRWVIGGVALVLDVAE